MKKQFSPQTIIDRSPEWLKSGYVAFMHSTRSVLAASGALNSLDARAKTSRHFHYLRSLLAIHDLPDMVGLDVPWWTYSATESILARLKTLAPPIKIFEWGSGASTIWLAKRADKVISIEHDPKWHGMLQPFLKNHYHVQSVLIEPDRLLMDEKYTSAKIPNANFKAYVTSIANYPDQYDFIIIDGRSRTACLEGCLPYLSERGIILFDNSDRARYQNALMRTTLDIARYKGKVPSSPFVGETAILTRSK